ncbi:MAG: FAD-dependent oxidoreductase [Bacteroidaceae bacterium]|nr:FAD-dependent oxidoreductase [Bacteroidaceae bacterium]
MEIKQRIAIIGGGVSGLSAARILSAQHDVTVFEADACPGGMIKCDIVEGNLFHRTGGHVFNTKRADVAEWFWSRFNRDTEFTKALRQSVISLDGALEVPYPIENNVYRLPAEVQQSCISDFLRMAREGYGAPENFAEFLRFRFGDTLYKLYFEPYNNKVWRRDLRQIPLSWLDGKLPMPTVEEIIAANFSRAEERQFVHSSFFYPLKGGSQFIAERLAEGLNICYNSRVERIERTAEGWFVEGQMFDAVIFCGNLKQIPSLIAGVPMDAYAEGIAALEAHGTTAVFCEIEKNPHSWIYLPDVRHESYRIICTGNFSATNNAPERFTATIEFTDSITREEIEDNLKRIPYNPRYLAHHYEPYTYPVQAAGTRSLVAHVKQHLEAEKCYLLGRFAEWEYYNMDVAIGAALDLAARVWHV